MIFTPQKAHRKKSAFKNRIHHGEKILTLRKENRKRL